MPLRYPNTAVHRAICKYRSGVQKKGPGWRYKCGNHHSGVLNNAVGRNEVVQGKDIRTRGGGWCCGNFQRGSKEAKGTQVNFWLRGQDGDDFKEKGVINSVPNTWRLKLIVDWEYPWSSSHELLRRSGGSQRHVRLEQAEGEWMGRKQSKFLYYMSRFIHTLLLCVTHSHSSFRSHFKHYFFRGGFPDHSALAFTSSRSPCSFPSEALTEGY